MQGAERRLAPRFHQPARRRGAPVGTTNSLTAFSGPSSRKLRGLTMSELDGCLILVVEDEPMIALHIADSFKNAGASVIIARTLADALAKCEQPGLTAAVIDHILHGGFTTSDVCARLKERDIPFVVYSGFSKLEGACASGELVHKPAPPHVLVATLAGILREQQRPGLN